MAGRQLAKVINTDINLKFDGFLDDNIMLQGTKINNKTIYHSSKLKKLKENHNIELVLLAIPSLSINQYLKIECLIIFLFFD